MSFLIIDRERYALQLGETTLGGGDDDLLGASCLAALPAFAVVESRLDDAATVRALPGGPPVRVGNQILGTAPTALRHGDRLIVGDITILYGDMRVAGRTDTVRGVAVEDESLLAELTRSEPTAPTGGVLIGRRDGARYVVPEGGLTIGRDPECGVVVDSKTVSRRHATIIPGLLGYTVADESKNGVLVNGQRISSPTLLRQGDIVRVADVEFRFEADAADFEPQRSVQSAEPAPIPGAPKVQAKRELAPLLATLEILTRGADEGKRFRIERPVVQLGRGPHNDVQLGDASVSASHATLVRRPSGWHLLDLGSRNGSYVDGERVTERVLDGVCELRLGNLKLAFRSIAGTGDVDEQSTRRIVGIKP